MTTYDSTDKWVKRCMKLFIIFIVSYFIKMVYIIYYFSIMWHWSLTAIREWDYCSRRNKAVWKINNLIICTTQPPVLFIVSVLRCGATAGRGVVWELSHGVFLRLGYKYSGFAAELQEKSDLLIYPILLIIRGMGWGGDSDIRYQFSHEHHHTPWTKLLLYININIIIYNKLLIIIVNYFSTSWCLQSLTRTPKLLTAARYTLFMRKLISDIWVTLARSNTWQ